MEEAEVSFYIDPDFPFEELGIITERLENNTCLVPGYVPPDVGYLAWQGFRYAESLQGLQTFILPDRNLVSRFARLARDGGVTKRDRPTETAIALMAFAQLNNLNFEPAIAYHELAHVVGNDEAIEELAWFRSADNAAADGWIDLALGRTDRLLVPDRQIQPSADLAFPLHRWRTNHVVALKIASLELGSLPPIERFSRLLAWMRDDFMIAGPAAILAMMYFSPRSARGGVLKGLRSKDDRNAMAGIANAAWDITHLSDFVRRAEQSATTTTRVLFASADLALVELASTLFSVSILWPDVEAVAAAIDVWWPKKHALRIVAELESVIRPVADEPARRRSFGSEVMDRMTADAEVEVVRLRRASGIGPD